MADIKISQLPVVTSLGASDVVPVVAGCVTSQITKTNLDNTLVVANAVNATNATNAVSAVSSSYALSGSYALTASYALNAVSTPVYINVSGSTIYLSLIHI